MNKKLTKDELDLIRQMNEDSRQIQDGFRRVRNTKGSNLERGRRYNQNIYRYPKKLAEKYGADSVINVKTGEVTKQEKDNGNS